jgi:hypothetical protein
LANSSLKHFLACVANLKYGDKVKDKFGGFKVLPLFAIVKYAVA